MGSSASTVCPICITLMSISSASAAMLSSFSSASISLRAASASHSCPYHQRRQQCRRPSHQRRLQCRRPSHHRAASSAHVILRRGISLTFRNPSLLYRLPPSIFLSAYLRYVELFSYY